MYELNLTLTEAAIAHLQAQLSAQGLQAGAVRIGVKVMGCSGYSYVVEPTQSIGPEDQTLVVTDQLTIVVAKQHIPIVNGSTVDYVKQGLNHRLVFTNPNESGSCGCGESFTVS
jgi:iron-sulfur cluster assembly protein